MPRQKTSTKTTKKPAVKKTPVKTVVKKTKTKVAKKVTAKRKTKTSNSILRILCFSNFSKDPKSLLTYLNEFNNQTYTEVDFILNIYTKSKAEHKIYKDIIASYRPINNIKIVFNNKYNDDNSDDLYLLEHIAKEKYNTFIYCDTDFNYNPNHIENLINIYKEKPCDALCVSCDKIVEKNFNLKKSNEKKYNFVFNNKAIDILSALSDRSKNEWIPAWSEHKIKVRQLGHLNTLFIIENNQEELNDLNSDNDDSYYQSIDNENFALCIFDHNYWSSFVYLNKRNNRMYNIDNDDHGAFEIKDNDTINIKWDTWGDEIFYKKYAGNSYYYSINE